MDWLRFFEDHNIDYTTRGPNTSRGWASVTCPFCEGNDPSQHLGVNLTGIGWSCWRDASHKGGKPDRLISALLGVNTARARLIAQGNGTSSPDSFDTPQATITPPQAAVTLPPDFKSISEGGLYHKFWAYLRDRDFDEPDLVINRYHLMAALTGTYKGRLIIPVYQDNTLIGWQGRALQGGPNTARYLTSSEAVKRSVLNYDLLQKGHTLYICEGPFDALKLDYYGHSLGHQAVCLFGVIPTPDQIQLLRGLRANYKHIVLMLDNDAPAIQASFGLAEWLPGIEYGSLPDGAKDPGSLSGEQVRELIHATH